MAHEVLTVLELAALLEQTFRVGLGHVRVRVLVHVAHHLRHIVPIDLELGYARFLRQDVPVESLDNRGGGWCLVQLRGVVLDVDVVSDAEELLAVLVAASEEDGSDADNVANRQAGVIRCVALESELHLAGLGAVHLDLGEDLVVLRVRCLAHILNAPSQAVLEGLKGLEEDLKGDLLSIDRLRVEDDDVDDVNEGHFSVCGRVSLKS